MPFIAFPLGALSCTKEPEEIHIGWVLEPQIAAVKGGIEEERNCCIEEKTMSGGCETKVCYCEHISVV